MAKALNHALAKKDTKTGEVDYARDRKDHQTAQQLRNPLADIAGKAQRIIDAINQGKVAMNYSPGVDFVGDKEFTMYVDDLVRHYLKVEPTVTSIATFEFAPVGADGKPISIKPRLIECSKVTTTRIGSSRSRTVAEAKASTSVPKKTPNTWSK